MSGKIKFCVRAGTAKDKFKPYYYEWYLKIQDENNKNKIVTVSPYYKEVYELLIKMLNHEKECDIKYKRNPPHAEIFKNNLRRIIDEEFFSR